MNPNQQLHALGQRLWLDNITRDLLDDGTLAHYIETLSVSGLTSNPSIFDKAIGGSGTYDRAIRDRSANGLSDEALFTALALEDLGRAAGLFRPLYDSSDGYDGWVSMEISPLLAHDASGSIDAALEIHRQAGLPNLFVKIPGTQAGLKAIEEAIFEGVPVNVTLLFSPEHYLGAAEAYMRGLERRLEAGRDLRVSSVASLFISRWDTAVRDDVPTSLHNRLGIAIGGRTYTCYRDLLASPRWQRLQQAGARPQRLLWASTGTKDPEAPETLYIHALAAPDTINTLPEAPLKALSRETALAGTLPEDGGDAYSVIGTFRGEHDIDTDRLAARLQAEGTEAFVESWQQLMQRIGEKRTAA